MLSAQQILDLPITGEEPAVTIGGFLLECLHLLVMEAEAFDPVSPIGGPGWEWSLAEPLVRAGLVAGVFEPDGLSLSTFNHEQFTAVLRQAINDHWHR